MRQQRGKLAWFCLGLAVTSAVTSVDTQAAAHVDADHVVISNRRLTTAITDTSSLRTAVSAWCTDATSAEATYGHMSSWDTSAVTSMENLFYTYCSTKSSFNEDISAWNTS